jgi:hypothetical protein
MRHHSWILQVAIVPWIVLLWPAAVYVVIAGQQKAKVACLIIETALIAVQLAATAVWERQDTRCCSSESGT